LVLVPARVAGAWLPCCLAMVVAGEEEAWLAMALRSARSSGTTGRELRRLQWQAFESSVGRKGAECFVEKEAISGEDPLLLMDKCLAAVAKVAGLSGRLTVSQAKEVLRSRGAGRLASRVGDVSKYRNRAAHRDVGLPELILDEAAACKLPEVAQLPVVVKKLGVAVHAEHFLDEAAACKLPVVAQLPVVVKKLGVAVHAEHFLDEAVACKLPEVAQLPVVVKKLGVAVHAGLGACEILVGDGVVPHMLQESTMTEVRWEELVMTKVKEAVDAKFNDHKMDIDSVKGELAKLQTPLEAMRSQLGRVPALEVHLDELATEVESRFGISEKTMNEKFICLERGFEAVRGSMCGLADIDLLWGELGKLQAPVRVLQERLVLVDQLRDALGAKVASIEDEVAQFKGFHQSVAAVGRAEAVEHKLGIDLLKGELVKLQAPFEAMRFQLGHVPALELYVDELAAEVEKFGFSEKALNEKSMVLERGLEAVRGSMCGLADIDLLWGEFGKLQVPVGALQERFVLVDTLRDALGYKVANIEDEVAVLKEVTASLRPLVHRRRPAV
jgi:hypothetical protein